VLGRALKHRADRLENFGTMCTPDSRDYLHTAHEPAPVLSTRVDGIHPTSEKSLRSLGQARVGGSFYPDFRR